MSSTTSNQQSATRRGQEYAQKAEFALREGKVEEAKTWHKNASNAFKEARDSLMEGDTNTKMALKILIDYHRDREKNPGDPKHSQLRQHPAIRLQLAEPSSAPLSTSSSTNSLPDAWNAVQEFSELIQSTATPPPLPEISVSKGVAFSNVDWKKGNQSVMAESYYFVGGETIPSVPTGVGGGTSAMGLSRETSITRSSSIVSPEKLAAQNKAVLAENERLSKEVSQLRSMLLKERDEAKAQKDKFWKMFVIVKAALEEAKAVSSAASSTSHESELKALTRLLHAESEARKKVEAELETLKRNFS